MALQSLPLSRVPPQAAPILSVDGPLPVPVARMPSEHRLGLRRFELEFRPAKRGSRYTQTTPRRVSCPWPRGHPDRGGSGSASPAPRRCAVRRSRSPCRSDTAHRRGRATVRVSTQPDARRPVYQFNGAWTGRCPARPTEGQRGGAPPRSPGCCGTAARCGPRAAGRSRRPTSPPGCRPAFRCAGSSGWATDTTSGCLLVSSRATNCRS